MADAPNTTDTPDAAAPENLTPEQVEQKIADAINSDAKTAERTPDQSFADSMIAAAIDLRVDQRTHLKKTTANRDLLRNLKTMGVLTETQATAVDLLYPERTKKTRERDSGAGNPGNGSTAADGVHVQVNPESAAAKRAPAKPAPAAA